MSRSCKTLCLALAALLVAVLAGAAHAQKKQLVVALNQDPDILDPTLSRTYVGRIVFAQICEKLYEIDESLSIQPQLAAALPAADKKLGDKFGTAPVCVGPWQFVERVPQDRIVVERSPHYFDQAAAKFDRIVFRIIPDDNVRLANLRSGDIDVMHQVGPTDAASLKKEGRFDVASVTGLGFNSITINLRNKTGKTNPPGDLGTPLANDPRVREALELSIDREAIVQVVYDGQYTAGCTPIAPVSPFFDKSRKCPGRDVARAKKLLADAGLANGYSFELVVI